MFINTLIMLVMALSTAAFAINNVAVLELIPNESIDDEISIGEFRHLTDELRRQAVMTLPKGEYSVLTRDNLISLMPQDEKEAECLSESCAVEIGRAIGAEYISQGTIGKFGKKLTISVELYETMSGKLLSSIVFESEGVEGLLGVVRNEAKPLFQSILDLKALSEPRSPRFKDLQDTSHIYLQSGESNNPMNRGLDNKNLDSEKRSGMRAPQWVGIGLAAFGVYSGVWGVLQNGKSKSYHDEYKKSNGDFAAKYKRAEEALDKRDFGYIAGSILLASGITIYFVF